MTNPGKSMRLLVNTLPIGSMSGEYVVYGFLRQLISRMARGDQLHILHYASEPPPQDIMAANVSLHAVPRWWGHWAMRTAWEAFRLPRLVKKLSIDRVLNASGAITPLLAVPQIALAMNPWCLVKSARKGWREEIKAYLQRRSYRHAFRKAAHMIYLSSHLRDLYRQANADCRDDQAPSSIARVGLSDAVFDSARQYVDTPRQALGILSVSAFARWKGVETLIRAVHLLRQNGLPASLSLVGPWPDQRYERSIRTLIAQLELQGVVSLRGKLGIGDLHRQYATHQVYCLMSRCESYGIPAAEAMAFGTPVVSSSSCAIAEICRGAGLFGPADDPQWTAQALASTLTDRAAWLELSGNARRNAAKLTWPQCAQALLDGLQLPVSERTTPLPATVSTPSTGTGPV